MTNDKVFVDLFDMGMDNELNAMPETAEEKFRNCTHCCNDIVGKAQELGHRMQESH